MKKILTIATILLASQQVYAKDSSKGYLRVGADGNMAQTVTHKSIKNEGQGSFGGFLSIGYNVTDNVSIEIGADYLHENEYKSHVDTAVKRQK